MTAVPVPRPLTVVALGGNALTPPDETQRWDGERAAVRSAAAELAEIHQGGRLLVVHGNGTQVGRLLAAPEFGDVGALDVHVAQTQGELGYLIVAALENAGVRPAAALVTRCLVDSADPAFEHPSKPVGPVVGARPDAPAVEVPGGWRRVVASPRPLDVVETETIATLLERSHVVAGGGGGVAVAGPEGDLVGVAAVIDKDWVAAHLAVQLEAERLIFVTNVQSAATGFGSPQQDDLPQVTADRARALLAAGEFAPGSMGPKVESAVAYAEATGRAAIIAGFGSVAAAMRGDGGTRVTPGAAGAMTQGAP